jgi:hypothetical protein
MVDLAKDAPRTRRALLTAAAAAGAAAVVGAVTKPAIALGAVDDNADMFVGNQYGSVSLTTGLTNHENNSTVFSATSTLGGTALNGASATGVAVKGTSSSYGTGVHGESGMGVGVRGLSTNSAGVYGTSVYGTGVHAISTGENALYAACSGGGDAIFAESFGGYGAFVRSDAPDRPVVFAQAMGGSAGVHGHAGDSQPAAQANTGVQGTTQGSGTGGYFSSPTGNAIRVQGKASFSRAGRTLVPKGRSYVDVTVTGGLGSSAFVVATLQSPRSGVWVSYVRINYPSAGKARIQLNKVASTTTTTAVGWIVIA